ncbi:gliding motility-associated C-terminal domain-containing protein [uncultured Winogradskyella sp.]|uniref:fibronectin type III domain-containing protein n=1 Tax=uncultured Winogradskyella sp. TaxID=395353 RepID=UPI0030D73686|tara:strand:- start:4783 stop:9834 length:5052 start_codon:yes stop_codon:yes gene_type:complete
MKKITLLLIMLGFLLTANAQYVFNPIVGPTNVAAGAPVTINLNDAINSTGVAASSTGSYDSFSITVDWVAGGGNPWSAEAEITLTTTAGSVIIDPATTGGLTSNADTTLTFDGDLSAIYDPNADGFMDLVLDQSFGGSDADWSNIEVTLFESPTCVVPIGMASSNGTTTSVDLNWTAGDSETTWNLEYNADTDFTPGNGEEAGSVTVNTTPTASLTGLTPFSNYFVYYQADCAGNGLSEWVGPFSFLTGYCESIPSSNDNDGIADAQLGAENFTSAGDVVFEDFTSPTVDLAAGVTANFMITFVSGYTYDVNVWIDFNNDLVYDNVTELVFQGETTNANPTIFDASFVMPNVPEGIYNMRMGSADFGQSTPNPCYDGSFGVTADFTVNVTAAPECIPASSLIAENITETSADLSWTDLGATGVTWDLEWGPAGFTPGTGTVVNGLTTTTYTLTGLTAGTSYNYYILTNCAATSSTLSGPSIFVTATPGETCTNAFSMPVETICDGSNSVTFNFANGGDIDANDENPSCDGFGNFGYFISFTAPAVGSVIINFDGAAADIGLEVYDACGGTAVSDCTNNGFDAGDNSGIIGGLTPGNTYVAVIWRDGQNGTADVCIQEGPTCPFPIDLTATTVTESSADLGWTENGSATSWNIEWGPAGFVQGTGTAINGVTTNPFNLAGLTQNTDYDFYVQAICTAETSTFTGPFTFTTTPQSNFTIDCTTGGPLTQDYCYENGGANNPFIFTFTSNDGTPLNLNFNSGFVENNWDELVVIDSDGTPFPGFAVADQNYGAGGNIAGLTFQSTGDTISFFINSDSSVSCGSGSAALVGGINYTVSCATCINPQATYAVIDDCDNGDQFLIDVDITSIGDATSLTISNNINGDTTDSITEAGIYQIGPFPFLVDVVVTISNDQDTNCIINSAAIQLLACPPENDNCDGAIVAVVNDGATCDEVTSGTILAATPSGVDSGSCTGTPNDDVWFEFTALSEVQIISIINIVGGTTNIDHAVYEGSCGTLTELYCSNDDSSVTTALVIGNTYYIRIFSGGSVSETSTFDLCIREAPSNLICDNAENFCSVGGALTTANIIGIPSSGQVACLFTAPNPTWNIIQIGDPGTIEIEINQQDDTGNGLDVDFVIWGPFDSIEQACIDIILEDCPTCPNNTTNPNFYPFGNIVDCSYSAASIENLTIDNAQTDEIYMLLVTNFNGNAGNITIEQTNAGGIDNGTIEAEISAAIVSDEVPIDPDNDPAEADEVSLCGFDSIVIQTDSPFADDYIWYKDGFVMPGETSATLTVTESNNYQVQAFDNQCGDDAFSQIVIVNLYDNAGTVALQNITVCDGPVADGTEDFDLDALSTALGLGAGFTVSYYTNTADANQAINAVSSIYNSSGETLIIRVEDTDAATNGYLGCRSLSEVELIVNARPAITQPADFIVCDDIDGSVDGVTEFDLTSIDDEITTNPDVVITYHTSQDDAENSTGAILGLYSSGGETIYVRAENTITGCYDTTSFNLEVNIVPLATFDPQFEYEVCPNATVPILIGIMPSNFTSADVSINWFLDGVQIAGANDLTLDTVLLQGDYSAEITFNATGCVNTITTFVMELESCVIPQGISPGVTPGFNDNFDLSSYGVTKLEIFNRNGTLVYSKRDYTNEWVGQTNDGEELPVGTYFYTMEYEGGTKKRTAWIYINR